MTCSLPLSPASALSSALDAETFDRVVVDGEEIHVSAYVSKWEFVSSLGFEMCMCVFLGGFHKFIFVNFCFCFGLPNPNEPR